MRRNTSRPLTAEPLTVDDVVECFRLNPEVEGTDDRNLRLTAEKLVEEAEQDEELKRRLLMEVKLAKDNRAASSAMARAHDDDEHGGETFDEQDVHALLRRERARRPDLDFPQDEAEVRAHAA